MDFDTADEMKVCSKCGGMGVTVEKRPVPGADFSSIRGWPCDCRKKDCPKCDGIGWLPRWSMRVEPERCDCWGQVE